MLKNKKKILLFLIIVVAIVGIFAVFDRKNPESNHPSQTNLPKKEVILGGDSLNLWVAQSGTDKSRGLSGVEYLESNGGMIFFFEEPGNYGFWMKDMLISIDILWFDANKKLVFQRENVSPTTYPEIFYPNQDILYVIELPAGKSRELGLKIDDNFVFEK